MVESFGNIDLPARQKDLMHQLLRDHHNVFVLSDGETDLIQLEGCTTHQATPTMQDAILSQRRSGKAVKEDARDGS